MHAVGAFLNWISCRSNLEHGTLLKQGVQHNTWILCVSAQFGLGALLNVVLLTQRV